MSEMAPELPPGACVSAGKNQPRLLPGRHDTTCPGYDECPGCQPCTRPHCRVCIRTHAVGTCGECLAETREALHQIGRMCGALPEEVEHRGVEGEAMFLLAPAADPEAIGYMEASVAVGRVPDDYLAEAAGELHPLWVLGRWDMMWRDALDHDDRSQRLTIATAVDYLDRNLSYMATFEHLPFEDCASEVKRCRNHLEAVLHDGEQVDRGAPCMKCGVSLHRCYQGREMPWNTAERPAKATADGWACPKCKRWHNDDQYRIAVKSLHTDEAEWLTDQDMQIRTGVKAGTVRSWARAETGLVRKKRNAERTVYSVADVMATAKDKGLVA